MIVTSTCSGKGLARPDNRATVTLRKRDSSPPQHRWVYACAPKYPVARRRLPEIQARSSSLANSLPRRLDMVTCCIRLAYTKAQRKSAVDERVTHEQEPGTIETLKQSAVTGVVTDCAKTNKVKRTRPRELEIRSSSIQRANSLARATWLRTSCCNPETP